MKKFRFCVIDDRHSYQLSDYGWRILIAPLIDSDYFLVPESSNVQVDRKGVYCYTVGKNIYYPKGAEAIIVTKSDNVKTVEDMLASVKSVKAHVFLIDIDLSEMDDINQYRKESGGFIIANSLAYDAGLKIIYSATEHTEQMRLSIRLLSNYMEGLGNLHLLDISGINQSTHQGTFEQTNRESLVKIIDSHIRNLQNEIIDLQSVKLRNQLKNRLEGEDEDNNWDTHDIPDDGTEESRKNPEKCWSLRTLFPKQINRIEKSECVEAMKQYIKDILNRDWRHLMKEGFLNHPFDPKNQVLKFGGRLEDAKETVQSLDFRTVEDKTCHYKRLTDLPAFIHDKELNQLRDRILTAEVNGTTQREYQIAYQHDECTEPEWQSIVGYFSSIYPKEADWFDRWCDFCINFGIYPMDIAYISHIAFDNRRHVLTEPLPRFSYEKDGDCVHFVWFYDNLPKKMSTSAMEVYKDFSIAMEKPQKLDDSGMSDLCKIICWRYRGIVEFRYGQYCVRATRNGQINVESLDNCKVFQGTKYRVSIHKP